MEAWGDATSVLREQPFDSAVFGAPVMRLIEPERFSAEQVDDWRKRNIWLVHCRVPSDDASAIGHELLDAGFRRIESLVTLEYDFSNVPAATRRSIVLADLDDVATCQLIARSAFIYSRYNRDPEVDQARAAEFKERWVENAIRGRADAAFVERHDGYVRGFNFCLLNQDVAVIDLIAVNAASQGQGIGRALVLHSLAHYRTRARSMRVGTQSDNTASLAMYGSCGFREVSRAVTYHWINRDTAR